jgi:signal transduction histidine kinase
MLRDAPSGNPPIAYPKRPSSRSVAELRADNEALVLAMSTAQSLQRVAEEALRRQTEALALAVHELRNPLMPIRTVASLLSRVTGLDELPRLGTVIERQVSHLSRLIEDLLDASRAATGKLHLQRTRVDLADVFDHALDVCRPSMDARQQQFVGYAPGRTLTVLGDPVRLGQVFVNLLQNASKYTPNGGEIVLTCELDATDELNAQAIVTIADNGIGITAETLPLIFDAFVQDNHAIGFSREGLGIGLTLVRELVQAHAGTVSATSPGADMGSQFIVTLPLA